MPQNTQDMLIKLAKSQVDMWASLLAEVNTKTPSKPEFSNARNFTEHDEDDDDDNDEVYEPESPGLFTKTSTFKPGFGKSSKPFGFNGFSNNRGPFSHG